MTPTRQIRACFNEKTIRVYQAYSHQIADSALKNGTFAAPFKMDRMTWIKPSFLWAMYRSGWAQKDAGQVRLLGIDIALEGFHWALEHSCLSHFEEQAHGTHDNWLARKEVSPVRIQWDPERDIHLNKLDHRSIQIGLSGDAVPLYVHEWITCIEDLTEPVHEMKRLLDSGEVENARKMMPAEQPYLLPQDLSRWIGIAEES